MKPKITSSPGRVLDFDIETVAAGFADPNWVPQRVTVIAWGWVDRPTIKVTTRLDGPQAMYEPFLKALGQADMVTGHNLLRFDLPALQADLMRLRMGALPELLVQDTMRLLKSKGFKKGQDNIAKLLGAQSSKLAMDWQDWEDAYEWDALIAGERPDWNRVIKRCRGDVRQHKQMRELLLAEGYLKPPVVWKP